MREFLFMDTSPEVPDEVQADKLQVHRSPIDEAARREHLQEKGYDEEEIIRDANFSHGFNADGTAIPQRDISNTPEPQRHVDEY